MSAIYDGNLLYQFLLNTPESALRKMLVSGQFTEVHFNMLMKFARSGSENDFCNHFYNATFPKLKYNAREIVLKEKFWDVCTKALNQHGLLSPAQKAAA
ncbi:MAG: hypothetical protein ACK4VO_02505 [Pseudobdellovibrio sp.]